MMLTDLFDPSEQTGDNMVVANVVTAEESEWNEDGNSDKNE